jgi:hypothetical protein
VPDWVAEPGTEKRSKVAGGAKVCLLLYFWVEVRANQATSHFGFNFWAKQCRSRLWDNGAACHRIRLPAYPTVVTSRFAWLYYCSFLARWVAEVSGGGPGTAEAGLLSPTAAAYHCRNPVQLFGEPLLVVDDFTYGVKVKVKVW